MTTVWLPLLLLLLLALPCQSTIVKEASGEEMAEGPTGAATVEVKEVILDNHKKMLANQDEIRRRLLLRRGKSRFAILTIP